MNPKSKIQNPKSCPASGDTGRYGVAVALAALLVASAGAQFPSLDPIAFTRGGVVDPTTGSPLGSIYVVGQPYCGVFCAFDDDTSSAMLAIGIVPAIAGTLDDIIVNGFPTPFCDLSTTPIRWDAPIDGQWNVAANWDPNEVPDNDENTRYAVLIDPFNDPIPVVTLNIAPTVTRLTLGPNSSIRLAGNNVVSRSIALFPSPGPAGADNSFSTGLIDVLADQPSENNLDLTLNGWNLDQTAGGVLRANAAGSLNSTLTLVGCRIRGGTIEALGNGRVRMLETIIDNCLTAGGGAGTLVVRAGADSTVRGAVDNGLPIEVESGARLVTTIAGATLDGSGRITLNSASGALLGGPDGVIANGESPGAGHVIDGAGQITGRLLNNGVMDANVNGQPLTVAVPGSPGNIPGFTAPVANTSIMQASGGGILRVNSALENSGEMVCDAGSRVEINGPITGGGQTTVLGGGTVAVTNSTVAQDCVEVSPGSIITVDGGLLGLMDFRTSGNALMSGSSSMTAQQSVQVGFNSAAALLRIEAGSRVTCNGLFQQNDGITRLLTGAELRFGAQPGLLMGGALFAGGSIVGTLNNVGGTVHPGDSPGRLNITGNYAQSAGGTLSIEIAGAPETAQFDVLQVTGTASLAGTLVVTHSGEAPGPLDEWNIVSAGTRTGTFATVQLPSPDWHACYLPGLVQIRFGHFCPCPGDLDGDRVVSLSDLAVLLSNYGTPSGATPEDGDIEPEPGGDGDVDLNDLALMLSRFGTSCP
jgi:hypothetical protein